MVVTVVLALVAACGGAEGTSSTAASPSSAAPPPTPTATSGTELPEQPPAGADDLVLERVRATRHDGGDRIVLTFVGSGGPGWAVRYVDAARADGSGERVDLDGDTILQLDVSGTPTQVPAADPVRSVLGGDVVDVHAIGAWEGVTQVFVGLAGGERPVRVTRLDRPSRLVLDLG